MRENTLTSLVAFASALIFLAPSRVDAQRTDLPRPDSSRPPLMTNASVDSIRYQTAYLHLGELLQAMQAGNATTMSALLHSATLGSATCGSVGQALSRVRTRARMTTLSDGGSVMALFFDKVKIVDSGVIQTVTADVVSIPTLSSEPTRSPMTLVLDPERGVWTREDGLVEALCRL